MRKELGIYHNQYIEIEAEYLRLATTNNCRNLLFRNVTHNGEVITDHIWIPMSVIRNAKEVNSVKLKKHTVYKMRGKVYTYLKYSKTEKKMIQDYCVRSVRIEMGE
jgi:hypothetical protein